MRLAEAADRESVRQIVAPLLTDEKGILKRLVGQSIDIFRIDNTSGDLVLVVPRSRVTDRDYLGLLLLARYLAFRAGLAKRDSMTQSELAEKSGVNDSTVSSRLSDLKAARVAETVLRGEYRLTYGNAERFIQEVRVGLDKSPLGLTQNTEPVGNYPKIEKPHGVRDGILKVLSTPWARQPRNWREIYEALKSNGYYFGEGNVSGSLTQLVKELKKVRRVKVDHKTGYVIAG